MVTACTFVSRIQDELALRNERSSAFFALEAEHLAEACRAMSECFVDGGRLIAFGRGPGATDAQHVSVEFVHPVIVGKRALPALDLSLDFAHWLGAVVRSRDMVMGFGPPGGDSQVLDALDVARSRGAMTFALPGAEASYSMAAADADPFVHQEIVETLYHTLWETVHVFLERREMGHDVGLAGFLYPFLGSETPETGDLLGEVSDSIRAKAAVDVDLRSRVASSDATTLSEAAVAIGERLARGGKIITLGNGGSATDANDFALDCVAPPRHLQPVPAVSLALEAANVTAIANDVGVESVFLRQLVAHAQPNDVLVAFSTSGGSRNIIAALEEARKRGLLIVAFTGYDGGAISRQQLADIPLVVPCDYIPRIQEIHASMYHVLRGLLGSVEHA